MEEDCDGYCMRHLIETEGIRPDVVVLGEPTDLAVYRGQRGRMEATITTRGVSAHGAHADRGVNALYKMAPIIRTSRSSTIEPRRGRVPRQGLDHRLLDRVHDTVAQRGARLGPHLHRPRLTVGETVESSMAELPPSPTSAMPRSSC